ncbi:MAG: UbiA family prenyltransferase [Gammaproteobacteria bacterium]
MHPPQSGWRALWRVLRPQQWVKNMLVFAPPLAAHETALQVYLLASGVFVALSACASAAYVVNDAVDRPHDRRHPRKRHRPLAAGALPLAPMLALAAALAAGGIALAFALGAAAGWWVASYALVALAYSLWMKRLLFADVVVLALLYTLRVLAGAGVAAITPSGWFLAFAVFLFLALALVKRQSELADASADTAHGRGYRRDDFEALVALGAASSFAAVLVLMLYIDGDVTAHYSHPRWLYLLCPLLIYMLGRVTLLARRGAVGDDPVAFVLRDRVSWLCMAGALAVMLAAV